jgi:hypothetical protein
LLDDFKNYENINNHDEYKNESYLKKAKNNQILNENE